MPEVIVARPATEKDKKAFDIVMNGRQEVIIFPSSERAEEMGFKKDTWRHLAVKKEGS
jgi:hypothetical protein